MHVTVGFINTIEIITFILLAMNGLKLYEQQRWGNNNFFLEKFELYWFFKKHITQFSKAFFIWGNLCRLEINKQTFKQIQILLNKHYINSNSSSTWSQKPQAKNNTYFVMELVIYARHTLPKNHVFLHVTASALWGKG